MVGAEALRRSVRFPGRDTMELVLDDLKVLSFNREEVANNPEKVVRLIRSLIGYRSGLIRALQEDGACFLVEGQPEKIRFKVLKPGVMLSAENVDQVPSGDIYLKRVVRAQREVTVLGTFRWFPGPDGRVYVTEMY